MRANPCARGPDSASASAPRALPVGRCLEVPSSRARTWHLLTSRAWLRSVLRPRVATSGEGRRAPYKQEVAGSSPAPPSSESAPVRRFRRPGAVQVLAEALALRLD